MSSRGVRGGLRSLYSTSNNARSTDDRRSPFNPVIVARRLFAGTTILTRPWSLSLNRAQVSNALCAHRQEQINRNITAKNDETPMCIIVK
ncbi:hypothetical protein DPMN_186945 [Dreissena polymorpha]|uniref:Uncharacterized protein n=1 Tax=Dreissena polymorpha TaxID=45954 RepID=A0A9D4DR79_DREPO|nr:hypothetical protein DPMN_186945 [Dreissena polymorpha]